MNCANMEKFRFMKQLIKNGVWFVALLLVVEIAQTQVPRLTIDSILSRIDRNNVLLQSYELKAESYKYSADAATAWMPPMVGAGTFMTPYPGQKLMNPGDRGNIMVTIDYKDTLLLQFSSL